MGLGAVMPPHGDATMSEYYTVYQSGAELLGVVSGVAARTA